MRRFCCAVVFGLGVQVACAAEVAHPSLFFDAKDVPALRAKAGRAPYTPIRAVIAGRIASEKEPSLLYDYANRNEAYLYLLTGERTHAAAALERSKACVEDKEFWNNPGSKGLTRAMGALNVAVAFDLCHDAWDEPSRKRIAAQLDFAADKLMASMGAGANNNIANNWQAVRYGSAGLASLAVGNAERARQAYAQLLRHLKANLGGGTWNPEGNGYTVYPWQFTGPFGIAAQRAGIGDLRKDFPAAGATLWSTMTATVPIPGIRSHGLHPDLSDDHPMYEGQGTAGLALFYAEPANLPAVRWMYDRLCGSAGDGTWDSARGGALYSLLFYPEATPAADPAALGLLTGHDPVHGVGYFRNAFTGPDDIVALVNATSRKADGGHNGPDVNTIRLIGLGAPFIVGGGRTGNTAGQSNLFPGAPPAKGENALGKLLKFEGGTDGSGRAELEGSCMGVKDHRRSFAADYSGKAGVPGLFANGEKSLNGRLWRLNTPEFNSIETSDGRILLRAPNGSTLAVNVIVPVKPQFRTGVVERGAPETGVDFMGRKYGTNRYVEFDCEGEVFVVMTLQKSTPPAVAVERGLHGIRAKVGAQPVVFDRAAGSVAIGNTEAVEKLLSRRDPIPVQGLSARAVSGGHSEIAWLQTEIGATHVEVERRVSGGEWTRVAKADFVAGKLVDADAPADTSIAYRAFALSASGRSGASAEANVHTLPAAMREWIDDFAPEGSDSQRIGAWTLHPVGGKGLVREAGNGSTNGAKASSGFLATQRLPIKSRAALHCEGLDLDLSSSAAELGFDFQSTAAMQFRPLLQFPVRGWMVGSGTIDQAKNGWKSLTFSPTACKWQPFDPATGEASGAPAALPVERLKQVTGVGLAIDWVINDKQVRIDQFRVRGVSR